MDLKEQRYVTTLASTGSLLVAATQLNITSSALSLYISNLEVKLGTKLFDRIGKQFITTYAGTLYVDAAKKMLEINHDFEASLSSVSKNAKGWIRVGFQGFRSPYIAPELILKFSQNYPHIKFQLYQLPYLKMEEQLLQGNLDLFFCNVFRRSKALNYIPIMNDTIVLMAEEGKISDANKKPLAGFQYPLVDLEAFIEERFLLHCMTQTTRMFVEELFIENNFHPLNTMEFDRTDTILQLAGLGYGITLMPSDYIRYPNFKKRPELFSIGKSPKMVEFTAVYRKGREMPVYMEKVIDIVKSLIL